MISGFFATGFLPNGLNSTNIVLIPKTNHPDSIKNFRPISICNTGYKVRTKIIAHRLRPILSNLISPFQSSFLPGRRISNNVLIFQVILEFINRPTKRKKYYMMIKIDIEKAFDCLK